LRFDVARAGVGGGAARCGRGGPGGRGPPPRPPLLSPTGAAPPAASVVVALRIRPAVLKARRHDPGDVVPIGQLLTLRGFAAVMVSSVVTVTSLDLLVIYLPALGAERHIGSDHIGLLLTVRSLASLVSRVFYARLIFAIGRA